MVRAPTARCASREPAAFSRLPQTIVVSSIFGELYSDNAGASFSPSVGGGTSQSVRYLGVNGDGGLKFGVTGQYGNVQGVCCSPPVWRVRPAPSCPVWCHCAGAGISVDGGKTFKAYSAGLTTDARYGAFPSDSVWYVAAGTCAGPCLQPPTRACVSCIVHG